MDELIANLVSGVQAANGTRLYRDMFNETPFEQRQMLPRALKQAKADGLLHETVRVVDGEVRHEYHLGAAPVEA
jgi:hypothetical protein